MKWILKKKHSERFVSGHPWVYSNELAHAPHQVNLGERVDLYLDDGAWVACGYVNPKSLIAFRVLERKKVEIDQAWLIQKIVAARSFRDLCGLDGSRRILYGEADGVPGLVIDEFENEKSQRFWTVQLYSAGAEKLWNDFLSAADAVKKFPTEWNLGGIVVRRDSRSRELESIARADAQVIGDNPQGPYKIFLGAETLFDFDLISGQKTGFFLDQRTNVAKAQGWITKIFSAKNDLKILDLFSYAGQWGVGAGCEGPPDPQISGGGRAKTSGGLFVTFADASAAALANCLRNAERYSLQADISEFDLLEQEWPWAKSSFDVVFCDPPALIKSKKHYFSGKRAYERLNQRALSVLKPGGFFVSSSCSQHLSRADLRETIATGAQKSATLLKIIDEGFACADHPQLPNFPEGDYLKTFFAIKIS